MPITRREFDAGERRAHDYMLEYLKTNANLAFSLEELLHQLAMAGYAISADNLQEILTDLIEGGRVESTTVGGKLYYSYRRLIGFRPQR